MRYRRYAGITHPSMEVLPSRPLTAPWPAVVDLRRRRRTRAARHPQRERAAAGGRRLFLQMALSGRAGVRALTGPVNGPDGGRRRFDAASPEPMRPEMLLSTAWHGTLS